MVTSDSTPNTWAHVAAKGAHNRHGTVDNRIEVVPQSASHDQASAVSPTADCRRPETHTRRARYWWGTTGPPLTNEGMI